MLAYGCSAGGRGNVRLPVVAGKFYSDDPARLRLAITRFMDDAVKTTIGKPIAIVVPHAGYVYSGQIMADGYKQAAGHNYDVVVILGTNHTTPDLRSVSVYEKGAFQTPLGLAEVDEDITAKLLSKDSLFTVRPDAHSREHSVEVQVPFIQYLFPRARIVPLVVGRSDLATCEILGKTLAGVLKEKNALIVASSDLSHYPEYDDAEFVDHATLEAAASMNPELLAMTVRRQMSESTPGLSTCACGEGPILTAMIAANELGAGHGVVVSYANSGDAPVGEYDRVVGYGAVVYAQGSVSPADIAALRSSAETVTTDGGAASINSVDRKKLLDLARKTIEWYLTSDVTPLPRDFDPSARVKQGAFVTLKEHGQLRGCIGHMAEDMPLCRTVGGMALAAAFEDHRFSPVTASEVNDLEIEISALTPFTKIPGPDQIVLGRDGVVIRKDGRSAVFLPQVATEQGWTRDEMLDHLCRKAGLPEGSWRKNADLFTFEAIVFSESKHE